MPILRKKKDEDEYYLHTSIGGRIITFQLTHEGCDRLLAAGRKIGVRHLFHQIPAISEPPGRSRKW